uniref:Fibrinogen C-terminal domain-containing protein n=1 Tax=Panagrellus redivivus TaxID=6233 RepID=A0A7E4WA72_PANRE
MKAFASIIFVLWFTSFAILITFSTSKEGVATSDYPNHVGKRCPFNQFDCTPLSVDPECIPFAAVRDCIEDCSNGADENCGVNKTVCDIGIKRSGARCGKCVLVDEVRSHCIDQKWTGLCGEPNVVKCANTKNCIYIEWINDGEDDCGDGSDENLCLDNDKEGCPVSIGVDANSETRGNFNGWKKADDDEHLDVHYGAVSKDRGHSGHDLPCDCGDVLLSNPSASSKPTYTVYDWRCTNSSACPFKVVCDFELLGGGWTLIMRRVHPKTSTFNRTWDEYKRGFGDMSRGGDFWLGNDRLHSMSTSRTCANELIIKLVSATNDEVLIARYDDFYVDDQFNSYRLTLGKLEQNPLMAPVMDGMLFARNNIFTTWDRRNGHCPTRGGGWWSAPDNCADNALTAGFKARDGYPGLRWMDTRIAAVEMMLRPKSYVPPVRSH